MRQQRQLIQWIIILFLLLGLLQLGLGATTTIDFETENSGYSASATEGTGDTDVFNRSDTDLGGNTTWLWAVEDLNLSNPSITLDQIDISGATSFTFAIDMIAHHYNDWDNNDELLITYKIDGGSNTNLMWVQNAGAQYNQTAALDTDFDGDGECDNVLPSLTTGTSGCTASSSTFETFTSSEISLSSNSTLDITLQFNGLTSTDEGIYLDNIVITTSSSSVDNPTSFAATESSSSQIDLSWTLNGSSDDVMVAWNSSNTFGNPSGSYSVSDAISGGGTVIYNGSGTSYNHTSLSTNTAYYYKAWSVDGSTNYSSGVTDNATTSKVEPTNHVTSFSVAKDGANGHSTIDLSWTANDGSQIPDGYLIKASTADNISDPSDGTAVSDNATIGSNSGAKNIAHGTNTYEWTGLTAETTYYFKIYPYTNSGTAIDYKTTATVPNGNATTDVAPSIPNLMISEVADPNDLYLTRFVELYNNSGSTLDFSSQTWYLCRQTNGGSTWEDKQLTGSVTNGNTYVLANENDDTSDDFYVQFGFMADFNYGGTGGNGDDGYFLYYNGDHSSGTLVDAYGVLDQDGTGNSWEYENSRAVRKGVSSGNTTWTASEWTISSANASDCTPGAIDGDQSLPVELSVWKATSAKGMVTLSWTTDSEVENQGFIIERSGGHLDKTWTEIASFTTNTGLLGQGSTSAQNDYSYIDKQVKVGETYAYRLSDVDYRGNVTRHAEISVTVKDAGHDLKPADMSLHKAYPNPFNPVTTISFTQTVATPHTTSLQVYDVNGRFVETLFDGITEPGIYTVKWDGNNQSSGIYFMRLSTDNDVQIQRVTLLR